MKGVEIFAKLRGGAVSKNLQNKNQLCNKSSDIIFNGPEQTCVAHAVYARSPAWAHIRSGAPVFSLPHGATWLALENNNLAVMSSSHRRRYSERRPSWKCCVKAEVGIRSLWVKDRN